MTRVDQQSNGGNSVAEKRVDFSYNALGQFTTIARYKDIDGGSTNEVATSSFSYDALDRLTDLAHKKGGSNLFTPYSWTFDYLSRVTGVTSQDGTASYTYDITSQLTATDFSYQTDESLSYDANGNRTMSGYSTGTNNQLTADGTYTYEYDNEGNRTKRTKNSDSSYTVYTWDYINRLSNVTEKNSSNTILSTVDYVYDTLDQRIKRSYDGDGPGAGSPVVSRYVYDGVDIPLQFDGSNNLTHRYLHGPTVDQILADENVGGTLYWPLSDDLGTVRDIVNSSGTVLNHLKFDSFGKVTGESNSAVDHIYGFTGRERDEETGLNFHRARYLDTNVGRWVSEDPIGFHAGQPSLVQYVGNSPLNFTDPNGEKFSIAGCAGGAVTGGTTGAVVGAVVGAPAVGIGAGIGAGIGGAVGAIGGCISGGFLSRPNVNAVGGDPNNHWHNFVAGGLIGIPVGIGAGLAGPAVAVGLFPSLAVGPTSSGIGWVYGGQVVTYSGPTTSHLYLGTQAGLIVNGVVRPGAVAFTVLMQNGVIRVLGSNNFGGLFSITPEIEQIVMKYFGQ